jgi:hypothetical protein
MITVDSHVARPDGSVRLVLRVQDATHPDEMLAGVGGRLTAAGTDALVTWDWGSAMVPPRCVETCTAHLQAALVRWATAFLGEPLPLHLLD